MPRGIRHAAAAPQQPPVAKYANNDGCKYINNVNKGSTSTGSSQPSPTIEKPATWNSIGSSGGGTNGENGGAQQQQTASGSPAQPVNRKKQKRRAKAAAKAAAEAERGVANGKTGHGFQYIIDLPSLEACSLPSPPASQENHVGQARLSSEEERDPPNGYAEPTSRSKKSKRKKKNGQDTSGASGGKQAQPALSTTEAPPSFREPRTSGMAKEKIWNTSSQEERERIKEFWLGLDENERKSLVKVEKDAVLKKMKEQQKHTCSCTVCGRKRTAIEEELEGLYDAYYQELEQFANHPLTAARETSRTQGTPRSFESAPGAASYPYNRHLPSHGRIVEHVGDEDEMEGDEVFNQDDTSDEEDGFSDQVEPSEGHVHQRAYPGFLNFGSQLQVKGGILTVADDLLKNDGQKFIEMMEQLAERRMQREEQKARAGYGGYGGDHAMAPANAQEYADGPPGGTPFDDDDYEDEDDYEEEEDEYYSQEEQDDEMTEHQRMEEGRRMFQIFAARMFEQRVLQAYREKVAKERQEKLLEELEDEDRLESQRVAKKAKEAQKRKEKAARKREAKEEERQRREAEKAKEEAERKEAEQKKAEEVRQRVEEKKRMREEQRKREHEERQRKEAEKQRRQHELREKQAEQERKQREAKEREKKLKEEARKRKEREACERKEQEEREKQKEAGLKAEKAEQEARQKERKKQTQEERTALKAVALATRLPITLVKRPAPHVVANSAPVPAVPHQPTAASSFASPLIGVATPTLHKAPTPMKKHASQASADAKDGAGPSPPRAPQSLTTAPGCGHSPHPATPVQLSPGTTGSTGKQHTLLWPSPKPAQPKPLAMAVPFPQPPPGFGTRLPHEPFPPSGFRPPPGLALAIGHPPNMNGPVGGGRGFPTAPPPPGLVSPMDPLPAMSPVFGPGMPKEVHSRQPSGGFDPGALTPIGRPIPIGRPASVVQSQHHVSQPGVAEEHHLGSSALLANSEEATSGFPPTGSKRVSVAPRSAPRATTPFPPVNTLGVDSHNHALFSSSPQGLWGRPPPALDAFSHFALPPGFGAPIGHASPMSNINMPWGPSPNASPNAPFGAPAVMGGFHRPHEARNVLLRKMLCRACEDIRRDAELSSSSDADAFVPLEIARVRVEQILSGNGTPFSVADEELETLSDTFGNEVNGGGSFIVRSIKGATLIRFIPDASGPVHQPGHAGPLSPISSPAGARLSSSSGFGHIAGLAEAGAGATPSNSDH